MKDRWVWGIEWRRELREWERSDLNSLVDLLRCRNSGSADHDRWVWKTSANGAFSVRSSYDCLMRRKHSSRDSVPRCCKLIWENVAVPKAQAIAWRVLFRKIATRSEMLRRGVKLPNSASNCALCGSTEETVSHLFFECRCVWELWSSCLDWIGMKTPLSIQAADNLVQFCNLGRGKLKRKILATLWVFLVWSI